MIFARCTATVFALKPRSAAISLFDFPATMCCKTSSSRAVKPRFALAFQRLRLHQLRIETVFPSATPLTAFDQIQIHRIFQNISARARFQRLANQRVFRMHAQHQNRRVGPFRANLPRCFDAADARQCAVHHRHARLEFERQLHRVVAVVRFADHRDRGIVFQHPAKSLAHQRVIVHEQHRNLIRHALPPPSHAAPSIAPAFLLHSVATIPAFRRSIPRARACPPDPIP